MSATERQERLEDGSAPVDDTSLGDAVQVPTAYMHIGSRDRTIAGTVDLDCGVHVDVDSDGLIIGVEVVGSTDLLAAIGYVLTRARL